MFYGLALGGMALLVFPFLLLVGFKWAGVDAPPPDAILTLMLTGPLSTARRTLKQFPGIADPGADRILLFAGIAPIAAVPSNATQVLVRVLDGVEGKNYVANYRRAQQAIEDAVPKKIDARTRAYLLVKHHGQEICKRTKPKCEQCSVSANCAYFARRPGS